MRGSKFGFRLEIETYESKRGNPPSGYTITFTSRRRLITILEKLGVKDVRSMLSKVLKNDFVAKVVISDEKPFVFNYAVGSSNMVVSGHYEVQNEFGVVL